MPPTAGWSISVWSDFGSWILFGLLGPGIALAISGIYPILIDLLDINLLSVLLIGMLGAVITLVRLVSAMAAGARISSKELALSALNGSLVSMGCMILSFYTIFRLLMMILIGQ